MPVSQYDPENSARPPGGRTSPSLDDLHPSVDNSGFEATSRSVPSRPHSPPRNNGNRHSVHTGGFDTRAAMEQFGRQCVELENLKKANWALQLERDGFRMELDQSRAQYLHMIDVKTDAENEKAAMEVKYKPVKKENKELNEEVAGLKSALSSRNSEIQKLQVKIKGYDEKLETQKRILTNDHRLQENILKREKQDTERRLRDSKAQCDSLGSHIETLQSDKKRLEKRIKTLEESLKKCKAEIGDLETAKKAIHDNCVFLERELGREAKVSQERNSDIRKAQESAFKIMMEPANWMPKADSEVRRMLDKIGDELWSWTKACVVKDFDQRSMSLHNSLACLTQLENGNYDFSIEDPRHWTKLPALICKATLTWLLYTQIFENPFFWQVGIANGTGDGIARPENDLYDIYMDTVKDDEKGGNEWRCQMLRTFDPSIATEDLTDIDSKPSKPEKYRRAAITLLIEDFLSRGTGSFIDSDAVSDDSRIKELDDILRRAARLSYRLWTQKTRIIILGISQLGLDNGDGVSRFSNGAELVQHHAYHNVELARDDRCLNGKPIAIMTHPAVIVYGDSSGENYSSYKVWKKAETWMG
ncbi:hypothetical protein BCR34DRAFT_590331 [Clohesyomyces aquaticus]|uniref:Uncharacterized protein n=1 Tax=Clohesyomyces aquaticus TaxID=1231657 RepID=A0A1Y1ZAQ4_9PLEO|nr:hypothetical protein BCR34DRAFT_590331 [Clohesyomyces aquaticus]